MDECDLASIQEEQWLKRSIAAARGIVVDIRGDGQCLCCAEEITERGGLVSRFCDKECAAGYERERSG